tara:strand:+ start:566 stop:1234 length:669 start_codon:yes stop_codon:yes gene_type:complete
MTRKTITAIIPVRKGSQRVKNKNFRKFANSNLLKIKIEALKQVRTIDNIVVSTDSEDAIKTAEELGVGWHKREAYYASSECNNSEFYQNLAENIKGDFLMYTPVTAPLIKVKTYYDFINRFTSVEEHDSMVTATHVKDHMWLDGSPVNYCPKNAPNTQDLPDILKLTYGINIISRNDMIKLRNIVGNKPAFYLLEDEESIDIDTPLEFEFAEFLYNKNKDKK